ncbi:MAG: L-aspartate oxidase [Gemmatimonadota bacterium]|jgi:L-aspartate oxidase|nr:L-aspartate oxidase [Gemmatimonadota bacterium]
MRDEVDVLVLGSGIAGLFFALKVAPYGRVAVVTKKDQPESNTNYAQGGIAAALAPDDSPALHARDTFSAGAGLCHADAVRALVREGPARVRELISLGARFTQRDNGLSLGREGGHSRRRIVHAADLTGREVERSLLEAIAQSDSVEIHENHMAVDLVLEHDGRGGSVCAGALVLPPGESTPRRISARVVMLATGGCGQVYAHTTNPAIATGDGVAMAYRAGARIANMEFVQFHPTALYPAGDRAFLISEAVRGEGAILRRLDGTAFMDRYHPLASLAPRDVVAQAIDRELKESGDPFVLLDCSPIRPDVIRDHFPNILAETKARGFDMLHEPIPVVPAAHYECGGVLTDTSGRTSLSRLYAVGEVACTGVHGANRLASNSLLEALVFAGRAAERIIPRLGGWRIPDSAPLSGWTGGDRTFDPAPDRARLRELMWELVGIVRSDERLTEASGLLAEMNTRVSAAMAESLLTPELLELRNLVQCGQMIVASAISRAESRGLNFNLDHPCRDNESFLRDTVIGA